MLTISSQQYCVVSGQVDAVLLVVPSSTFRLSTLPSASLSAMIGLSPLLTHLKMDDLLTCHVQGLNWRVCRYEYIVFTNASPFPSTGWLGQLDLQRIG